MANWLLGTEALHGFLEGPGNVVHQWTASRTGDALYASGARWAGLRGRLQATADPLARQQWLDDLDVTLPREFGPRLLDVRPEHWKMWSTVRNAQFGGAALGVIEAMDVALCRVEGFSYVSRRSALASVFAIQVFYP